MMELRWRRVEKDEYSNYHTDEEIAVIRIGKTGITIRDYMVLESRTMKPDGVWTDWYTIPIAEG